MCALTLSCALEHTPPEHEECFTQGTCLFPQVLHLKLMLTAMEEFANGEKLDVHVKGEFLANCDQTMNHWLKIEQVSHRTCMVDRLFLWLLSH